MASNSYRCPPIRTDEGCVHAVLTSYGGDGCECVLVDVDVNNCKFSFDNMQLNLIRKSNSKVHNRRKNKCFNKKTFQLQFSGCHLSNRYFLLELTFAFPYKSMILSS